MVNRIVTWFVSLLRRHGYIILEESEAIRLRSKPDQGDYDLLQRHILNNQDRITLLENDMGLHTELINNNIDRQSEISALRERVSQLEENGPAQIFKEWFLGEARPADG